jgi:hypothetical protein
MRREWRRLAPRSGGEDCVGTRATQSARAINESSIESTSVDMNGNEYSRPKSRTVKSPGKRPTPSFLSHGQQADSTISAINVVSSQRIMIANS